MSAVLDHHTRAYLFQRWERELSEKLRRAAFSLRTPVDFHDVARELAGSMLDDVERELPFTRAEVKR